MKHSFSNVNANLAAGGLTIAGLGIGMLLDQTTVGVLLGVAAGFIVRSLVPGRAGNSTAETADDRDGVSHPAN